MRRNQLFYGIFHMDLNSSLLILLSIYLCFATKRTIKKVVEDKICNATTTIPLLHMIATKTGSKEDAVHYIISTSERPTIVVKHILKSSKVTFNKTNICNKTGETFSFDHGGTSDLSGLVITKLYSYNDEKDEVSPHPHTHIDNDILGDFNWKHIESNGKEVVFKGTKEYAQITFTINVHAEDGHSAEQPKNPITSNLTEFRIEMRNLTTKYEHTRYAVEVLFFSTAHSNSHKEAKHTTTQYIDDEYTPGIFEIWAVKLLPHLTGIKQTFVTWKPVSYNSDEWKRNDQGLVKKFLWNNGEIVKSPLPDPLPRYNRTVPWTLISDIGPKYYGVNVSFGIAKDGFYNKHKYLSWSGMVGSGTPPVDSMSMKLILTIAIGLGIPGVVILVGVVFLLIKGIQQSAESSYDEIH